MSNVSVALLYDLPLAGAGLRALLHGLPDITVAGEAEDVSSLITLVTERKPDLILLSSQGPDADPAALTAAVRVALADPPPVLVLVESADLTARRALAAGAQGVLAGQCGPELFTSTVRMIAEGYKLIPPLRGPAGADLPPVPDSGPPDVPRHTALTRREMDIIELVVLGYTNRQIAETFGLTAGAVKSIVQRIQTRLQVSGRVQIVTYAFTYGLVCQNIAIRHVQDGAQ